MILVLLERPLFLGAAGVSGDGSLGGELIAGDVVYVHYV